MTDSDPWVDRVRRGYDVVSRWDGRRDLLEGIMIVGWGEGVTSQLP